MFERASLVTSAMVGWAVMVSPFASPARAQDAGVAGGIDASMVSLARSAETERAFEPDAAALPIEVEVKSARERGGYSASAVTRERDVLAAAPHRTANDMLLLVPGLFVTQHSGEGKAHQIFYRGFDAVHGQDLELWVGGAPVNDVSNLHGQGYADLHFIMPELVRTMRVSPGNYDPRQGDFAVAGTVRFELGYDQPGLSAKAGYGSYDSRRFVLAYRPKNMNEQTFAAAEFYDTDGFGPSRAAQRASGVVQAEWELADDFRARVMFSAYSGHFDSAGVLRLRDIESGASSRYATYDPNQGGASTRVQLVAELKREADGNGFHVAPYVVLRTLRLRQNFTGFLSDANGDSQQQLNDDVAFGATAHHRQRTPLFSPRDRLEVGVSARSDWIDQSQKRLAFTDQSVTREEVQARVHALDIAGYVDAELHPWRWITLRGGVRIDGLAYRAVDDAGGARGQARASQGLHVGPKASLCLAPWPGLTLSASYGEGFRSPQARSLAESERTPFTKVRSTEAGVRYANAQVAGSVAVFRTWLSDDLVFDPATVRNERVPATRRTGLSADATWRPREWATLNANFTYTRAVFRAADPYHREGDLVPYAPQIVARVDAALQPVLWKWRDRGLRPQLGVGLSYLERRPLPYSQFGHRILLVDAQAGVRFGEVALSLRAFNLLDTNWYDGEFSFASNWDAGHAGQAASLVPMRHVTAGAPRTLFASLELFL